METIEKLYKITNWCTYHEVELIDDISGMTQDAPVTYTTKEGHLCTVKTWLDMATGSGFEIRSFKVTA